jgi:acyl carrier protein
MVQAANSTSTALNETAVREGVREQVAAELKIAPADVADDAVIKQLPGADSVRLMRIVARVERDYKIEFEDEDVFAIRTLDELVGLILRQPAGDQP